MQHGISLILPLLSFSDNTDALTVASPRDVLDGATYWLKFVLQNVLLLSGDPNAHLTSYI